LNVVPLASTGGQRPDVKLEEASRRRVRRRQRRRGRREGLLHPVRRRMVTEERRLQGCRAHNSGECSTLRGCDARVQYDYPNRDIHLKPVISTPPLAFLPSPSPSNRVARRSGPAATVVGSGRQSIGIFSGGSCGHNELACVERNGETHTFLGEAGVTYGS